MKVPLLPLSSPETTKHAGQPIQIENDDPFVEQPNMKSRKKRQQSAVTRPTTKTMNVLSRGELKAGNGALNSVSDLHKKNALMSKLSRLRGFSGQERHVG